MKADLQNKNNREVNSERKNKQTDTISFEDNRKEAVKQREAIRLVNNSVMQRRVLTIGSVKDPEVVVASDTIKEDTGMDKERFENVNSMSESENEIFVGHGTPSTIGMKNAEQMSGELEKKMEKEKNYEYTFFACNTGKGTVEKSSVGETVAKKLVTDGYNVSIKAPSKYVYVIGNNDYLMTDNYPVRNREKIKTETKKLYNKKLREIIDEILKVKTESLENSKWEEDRLKIENGKKRNLKKPAEFFKEKLIEIKKTDVSESSAQKKIKLLTFLKSYEVCSMNKDVDAHYFDVEIEIQKYVQLIMKEVVENMESTEIQKDGVIRSNKIGDTTKGWNEF